MKIGYYCESSADQAAMAVFTEGLLGEPPEPVNMDLEAHSVPGFFSALDGVFRGVHYNSDADALIVVVDCVTRNCTIRRTSRQAAMENAAACVRPARSLHRPGCI